MVEARGLVFACVPLVVLAGFHDGHQYVLKETKADLVVPLTLGDDLQFTLQSASGDATRIALADLQHSDFYRAPESASTVIVDIPFDVSTPGSLTYRYTEFDTTFATAEASSFTWLPTNVLASTMMLEDIGVRKGDMVTMPASFTHLELSTPHIQLPVEIFDILLQATSTSVDQGYVVDCAALDDFPELVFGLRIQDADGVSIVDELVISPEQYVLESNAGQCVLLAREVRGSPVMGWAAIRGRRFVIDWTKRRMGFAQEFED